MEVVSRFRLRRLDEVASTNEVVKAALEAGEPECLAVTAAVQRGGYGRQGRSWSSPRGGMYLSVLLRPDVPAAQLPTLSLAVAVAVRRALAALVPARAAERIQVKWPNDIVIAEPGTATEPAPVAGQPPFRKLVGISLERHAGGVCVGIGVNVVAPAEAVPVGGKNAPCYLADLGMGAQGDGAVETVRQGVLRELGSVYDQWLAEGFGALHGEYERHDALAGRSVAVEDREGNVLAEGIVLGTDAHGCLLVQDARTGAAVPVASGEAHVRYQLSSS